MDISAITATFDSRMSMDGVSDMVHVASTMGGNHASAGTSASATDPRTRLILREVADASVSTTPTTRGDWLVGDRGLLTQLGQLSSHKQIMTDYFSLHEKDLFSMGEAGKRSSPVSDFSTEQDARDPTQRSIDALYDMQQKNAQLQQWRITNTIAMTKFFTIRSMLTTAVDVALNLFKAPLSGR